MIGYVLLALVSASLVILYALARRQHLVNDFKSWGRNVLFVIAHPDDEAMFFVPTIAHLVASGAHVHILCLSSGNYDGLGAVRALELQASARVLRAIKAVCVEHAQLQDGPHSDWPPTVIAEHVRDYCSAHNIDSIATFDAGGVSGHPNHVSTARGVLKAQSAMSPRIPCFELETTGVVRKYLGVVDVVLSNYYSSNAATASKKSPKNAASNASLLVVSAQPWLSYRAMQAHHSQFVWFRYLFVAFSRYTFMNSWRQVGSA